MAHFYATMQGNKGEATRCGTKGSGMNSVVASWQGAVQVQLHHDAERDEDWVSVWLTTWHGAGAQPAIQLYDGPISGIPEQIARRMTEC